MKKYSLLVALVFWLGGCSTSPSPVLPPVKLTPVHNAFKIEKVWEHDFGDGAGDNYLKLKPILDKQTLYILDYKGLVTAFNVQNHSIRWQVKTGLSASSALTLDNDLLFFGTSQGDVVAMDKSDGKVVWDAHVSSEVLSPPQVAKGYVVVRCVNGMMYALSRKDGKQLWSLEETTPALTLRGTSTPVITGDIIISGFDNGRLLAINLESGKVLWQTVISIPRGRTDLERMVDIDANPIVVNNDVVFAVTYQGRLAAVQLGSGRILWTRDINSYNGMVVDPYRIYLVDDQSRLWALDRQNGATLWKTDSLIRRKLTRPVLQNQYLVVGDFDGFIHWLRRDNGKLVARVRMNTYDYTDPNLDETQDLKFPKHNNILAPPLVDGDSLIAVDRYGHTEAYKIHFP